MLNFRFPKLSDCELYYKWANDKEVREQSFTKELINYKDHIEWFKSKIQDPRCKMYLFEDQNQNQIGQVRIEIDKYNQAIISISIDTLYRGRGYGTLMLQISSEEFNNIFPNVSIHAYIKSENIASSIIFEKANFEFKENIVFKNSNSVHYVKYENR